MSDYTSWEESKGRIADRFERLDKSLETISRNVEKLVWLLVTAVITLVGHAIISYIQMSAK